MAHLCDYAAAPEPANIVRRLRPNGQTTTPVSGGCAVDFLSFGPFHLNQG
jgi:hypothetical protein